ncbi:NAD(P)-binding domain-containing protein [Pseudodonghicola xiamenensis]|uniref:Pyrroline-5-carboxylate reductase n=1 Tax=Pseudodonghicola xiamenensis TaxID=337702 RepID=A0A8J3H5L7_9RHOB|nr:NAD(P)-binding domain-containing protein [Pseudodonghicola xiamenensis]GHG81546.1 pyrroline-5-carboxylate reductase [Pseudodonghicola xiamenensis]
MYRIGFLGTGHIAAPMVRFLARTGHDITVSDRNAEIAAALEAGHGVAVAPNQKVVDGSEVVFLCLRPHLAEEVLQDIRFHPGQRIVSVMAGISLDRLKTLCAPAGDITITIPLGFLEQGGCPLPAYPSSDILDRLFEPENTVFEVPDERALNMHFAICAMVPGLLDLMATGAEWLGHETGEPEKAEFYTTQLFSGFLAAMTRKPGALACKRDALATQGTISLQMTEGLQAGGVHTALTQTLDAIRDRLNGQS